MYKPLLWFENKSNIHIKCNLCLAYSFHGFVSYILRYWDKLNLYNVKVMYILFTTNSRTIGLDINIGNLPNNYIVCKICIKGMLARGVYSHIWVW